MFYAIMWFGKKSQKTNLFIYFKITNRNLCGLVVKLGLLILEKVQYKNLRMENFSNTSDSDYEMSIEGSIVSWYKK